MINSIPNPTMTWSEVIEFRRNMRRCLLMDFTPKEKDDIERRKKEIKDTYENIKRNSGGKNSILNQDT